MPVGGRGASAKATTGRSGELTGEDGDRGALALGNEGPGPGGPGFSGGGVLRHRQHGGCDTFQLGGVVEIEEPVAETDVAPHETF